MGYRVFISHSAPDAAAVAGVSLRKPGDRLCTAVPETGTAHGREGIPEDRLAMLKGVAWVEFDPGSPAQASTPTCTELRRLPQNKQTREELLLTVALVAALVLLVYFASKRVG